MSRDHLPVRICHYPRRDGPLPDGARWVGRPSRWGNPHRVGEFVSPDTAVDMYRITLGVAVISDPTFLDPLRDATALACACPVGSPCHADVLIKALQANEPTTNDGAI